jgi:hypothetical protein
MKTSIPPTIPAATSIPAKEAIELILQGTAPDGLRVTGHLDFSRVSQDLTTLPERLTAGRITLNGCRALRELPTDLRCNELELRDTGVTSLPADIQVAYRLDLSRCHNLESLPDNLKVGALILSECTALRALPEGLDVCFLDISGCTALAGWPERASLQIGRLNARGCSQLRALPPWLGALAQLDVSGCVNLSALPEGLRVSSWLDLAGTAITALPAALRSAQLRWRGVRIDERVAFHPETITAREVFSRPNAELRRVLLERMGYGAFIEQAAAEELDRDQDPGGLRRLLRVRMEGDEPLVILSVSCPSTGRQYLLRVPPALGSCRQAAAWIAGFDNPDDYAPLAET